MEATITINMDLSDLDDLESLRKKLDEIEEKKNFFLNNSEDNNKVELNKKSIMKLMERYGVPKEVYTDQIAQKVNKERVINFRVTELMVKVFIALLDQAAEDGDESYEKMASWIENIPYCSGMPLSEQEKVCFELACIRSVPGEIDTEDTPDE